MREKSLSILVPNWVRYIFLGLGRTAVASLLLTMAMSANPAAAEDKLVAGNPSSEFSSSQTPFEDYASSEILAGQDLGWGQVTVENHNPSVEFSSFPAPQKSSATFARVAKPAAALEQKLFKRTDVNFLSRQTAKPDADLAQKLVTTKKAETIIEQKQPQLIAQTDSSGVVGDTLGETNRLRQELLIEPIVTLQEPLTIAPGSSAGTPTGYGASWRQAFIGGGVYFPLDKGKVDGSLIFGFGVGDAVKSVGLEFDFNVISVGGQSFGGDFGESGAIGLKLHKYFTDGTAVALGWYNPIKWGDAGNDKETFYGVVTKAFDLQPNNEGNKLPLTLSVGIGTGDFSSLGALRRGDNSVNVFGSAGLRVASQVSLVSSWTGNALNMGASFTPFRKTPLVVNTIFTDVTSNFENGLGFAVNVGYIFEF
jgi:hypothetical protein